MVDGRRHEDRQPDVAHGARAVGYSANEIKDIVAYIDERRRVRPAALKDRDWPVRTRLQAGARQRSSTTWATFKMVGATQPVPVGRISKTSRPKDCTVDEYQAYIEVAPGPRPCRSTARSKRTQRQTSAHKTPGARRRSPVVQPKRRKLAWTSAVDSRTIRIIRSTRLHHVAPTRTGQPGELSS